MPYWDHSYPTLMPQFDWSRPNRRAFFHYCHDVVCSHRILATTSSQRRAAPGPRNACCRKVARVRRSNIAWSGIPRWNVGRFSRRRARHRTPRAHESGHAYDHDRSYPHHGRWPAGDYARAKIGAASASGSMSVFGTPRQLASARCVGLPRRASRCPALPAAGVALKGTGR